MFFFSNGNFSIMGLYDPKWPRPIFSWSVFTNSCIEWRRSCFCRIVQIGQCLMFFDIYVLRIRINCTSTEVQLIIKGFDSAIFLCFISTRILCIHSCIHLPTVWLLCGYNCGINHIVCFDLLSYSYSNWVAIL